MPRKKKEKIDVAVAEKTVLLTRFGNTVYALRKEQGKSQIELVNLVGVAGLSRIERAETNPGLTHISKIAKGLGMTASKLLKIVESGKYVDRDTKTQLDRVERMLEALKK